MKPSFLIAYPFLERWEAARRTLAYESWVLDSGAFSVARSGGSVDLDRYIEDVRRLNAGAHPPRHVFALDVIGDHVASRRNADRMRGAGLDVVPTFHFGEPWEVLDDLCRDFPLVALGGAASFQRADRGGGIRRGTWAWAREVFSRKWPHRFHGFAYCAPRYVRGVPFESVDSTAWFLQSKHYRCFLGMKRARLRGARMTSYRGEIEWYLRLEREVRFRWRREMEALGVDGPTLYLACPLGSGVPTGYEVAAEA